MDRLARSLQEFNKLLGKNYIFTLSDDTIFELYFHKRHFAHLIGLHKLTDIGQLHNKRADFIYGQIKKGNITEDIIKNSTFFGEMESRLDNFYDIDKLLVSDNLRIIIDFEPSKTPAQKSSLKSTLLFSRSQNSGYSHLCLAPDARTPLYYPETFFYQPDDFYVKGQNVLTVKKLEITSKQSKISK